MNNQTVQPKPDKYKKLKNIFTFFLYSSVIVAISVIVWGIFVLLQNNSGHFLTDISNLGQFYSGTVIAFLTIATISLVALAFLNQLHEIELLQEMNKQQTDVIKQQTDALKEQQTANKIQKQALELQKESSEKQLKLQTEANLDAKQKSEFEKFERTFYRLLDWHMSFMNSISYVVYGINLSKNVYISRGAINQVFNEFQRNMQLNIEKGRSIDEAINIAFHLLFKSNDDMKPYYNNLYSVIEFVDDHYDVEVIDRVDENKFIAIIANQLSNSEVLLLCYYGLYSDNQLNTKKLIENLGLLRNIQKQFVEKEVLDKYDSSAFETYII